MCSIYNYSGTCRQWGGGDSGSHLLFNIMLRRRLRLRVQDMDTYCPMCGGTMDSFGDHALTCPCKGDRTIRHNRLRDTVLEDAALGNMSPEREKLGLLPGRPPGDNIPCDSDGPGRSRRRPADIFIPRAFHGVPTALDFAVTSGLRADTLMEAATDPTGVLDSYEQLKMNYVASGETESTAVLCTRQGLSYVPMIIEAHGGGWSKLTLP